MVQIQSKDFAGTLGNVPVFLISEAEAKLYPLSMRASDQRAYLTQTELDALKAILTTQYGWKSPSA